MQWMHDWGKTSAAFVILPNTVLQPVQITDSHNNLFASRQFAYLKWIGSIYWKVSKHISNWNQRKINSVFFCFEKQVNRKTYHFNTN
jgi:hypothetical protein